MKRSLALFIFILLACANGAWAGPFKTNRICIPAINPNQLPLEFQVVEKDACAEGETLMEVREQSDGTTILLPYVPGTPADPEAQKMLEEYKKFNGISP